MPLNASDKGGSFDPVPAGVHEAVCYAIYDLGSHLNQNFGGKLEHKIMVCWEIPGERIEIDKDGVKKNLPRAISKRYTLSLNEKANLRKDLESWRGRPFTEQECEGFDVHVLVGHGCQLNVVHEKRDKGTYANVQAIMPLAKVKDPKTGKMVLRKPEPPENPIVKYSIPDDGKNIPASCPEFIRKLIMASQEWQSLGAADQAHDQVAADEDLEIKEDSIPF